MTTLTTPPSAPPAASGAPEPTDAARRTPLRRLGWVFRRRRPPLPPHLRTRRRRLLLASMPFVVLFALVAIRLVTLNVVHDRTLAAYQAGDRPSTLMWGERQGWVNVVEQFRSPFAIGDAHVLTGHYELARPWFEQAFEQVPKGGVDDCKVRVNLGLTYEALGDAAKARERTAEWKQFYDKGIKITQERPQLCDAPEGGQTGEQLEQAQQRMEDKSAGPPGEQPPTPDPQQPPPQPQPSPDTGNAPSQEQQDLLQELQRRNTVERNQQLSEDERSLPEGDTQTYPRPW